MFKIIGLIIMGIVIAKAFGFVRAMILNKVKDMAKEKFSGKKLRAGLFRIKDKVAWAKDIAQMFNLRRLCIYLLIAGIIYGVGVYKGKLGKPINVDLNYEKSFTLKLDGQVLYKPKNSSQLEIRDAKGNKIKTITVGDVKELRKKLSPFGLQFRPIGVIGYGAGLKRGFEAGAGISFLRYWKWRLDTFLTNHGIYIGNSYKITDNSNLGIGAGKGFKGDSRIIFYYRWKF